MKKVTVYSTDYCPYCRSAKQFLEREGIPFEEFDLTHDPVLREKVSKKAGMKTVPMIFVGENLVGGFDDMMRKEKEGSFRPLLAD